MGTASSSTVFVDYYNAKKERIQILKQSNVWIRRFQGQQELEVDVKTRPLQPKEEVDIKLDILVFGFLGNYHGRNMATLLERKDPLIRTVGSKNKLEHWFALKGCDYDLWYHVAAENIKLITIEADRGVFSFKHRLYLITDEL